MRVLVRLIDYGIDKPIIQINIFENLEKTIGLDIIISGHPKYKNQYENLFCGRNTFQLQ